LLTGVGTILSLTARFSSQPLHNGKPVSYWVDEACSRPNQFEAQKEVHRIGAAALPYLIAKLNSRETWVDRLLLAVREKLPTPVGRLIPAPHKGPFDRSCAAECLALFGREAKPAVNALAQLVGSKQTNGLDADRAIAALGAIGPEARQALPSLRRALKNQTPEVRRFADEALEQIGSNLHSGVGKP